MPLTLPQQRTFETVWHNLNDMTDEDARDLRKVIALAVSVALNAGQESRSKAYATVTQLARRYGCHRTRVENALYAAHVRPKASGKRLYYLIKDADLAWQSYTYTCA